MDAGDRAVTPDPGAESHEHRMASAMTVEDFFTRQTDLDRSIEERRSPGDDDLVVERIALAAEAAAVRGRDDADVSRRQVERFRQRAMDVVRRLCARPQYQLAVRIEGRHGGML